MAPRAYLSMPDLVENFSKCMNPNQTSFITENTYLIDQLNNLFKVKQIQIHRASYRQNPCEKIKKLTTMTLKSAIQKHLEYQASWEVKVTTQDKNQIAKEKSIIEEYFPPVTHPLIWSWYMKQLSEVERPKKILSNLLNKEVIKIKKLKKARYGLGGPPLKTFNMYYNALVSMSNKVEKIKLSKLKREMSLLVSKLPQLKIKT